MPRPTDALRAEHTLTGLGLAILDGIAGDVRAGGSFPGHDVAEVLRFLREFLLAVHMRKEGEILCPLVAMYGDERAAATVGDLVRLQDEVRELLHTLVLFWEPTGDLTPEERLGFADAASTFASRVTRMQAIEERELFPTWEAAVPGDEQIGWQQRFAELECTGGTVDAWRHRLQPLAARWVDGR